MGRTGWVAAGLVVAASSIWLTATDTPVAREQGPETDVDGVFEASVPEPLRQEPAAGALVARAEAPAAKVHPLAPDELAMLPQRGPVAALTERFETEPRDSAAPQLESAVHAAFSRESIAPELFKSVLCRETVCKLVVQMTPERMPGYNKAMTELVATRFAADVAVAPASDLDADHARYVDLYLQRRQPSPP